MAQEKYRAAVKRQPAAKAAPKAASKPTPSPEQKKALLEKRREEARRLSEQKKKDRLARKSRRKKLFALAFLLSLVFVGIYWGWVAFSIHSLGGVDENALPVLLFTDGKREEDARLEAEEVNFDGEEYLPVTVLENYMSVSVFGDHVTRSFLLSADGQYATFTLNSCNVVINGEKVSMKGESFLKDDVLYLPVDFYTEKMTCFTYTHSSALAANVLTFLPENEITFTFQGTPTSPTVDFATVPVVPTLPEDPENPENPDAGNNA